MRSKHFCSSTAGTITQSTLLEQLEAGEVLGDDFDVEEELEGTQNGGMIEMDQPEPEVRETMPEESAEPEDQEQMPE